MLLALASAVPGVGMAQAIVTDPLGNEVTVPQPIERIVCPYAMATYYLYALGAGERLVRGWYIGVRSIDDAPDALRRLEPQLAEKLSFGEPNLEEILRFDADVVLVDASRHAAFAELAAEVGLPVLRFAVETPEGIVEAMRAVAQILGEVAIGRAEAFGARLDAAFAAATGANADGAPRVLFLGATPLLVASGDMYQTRLIEAAGGVSVSAGLRGYWAETSLEQILVWDPEVVVIPSYSEVEPASLLESPDWATIAAVRSRRVYKMERLFGPWDTPVPDSLLGILWLAARLHPDGVAVEFAAEARRFYEEVYGYSLSAEEEARLAAR